MARLTLLTVHVPGYARPILTQRDGTWYVTAQPYDEYVGQVEEHDAGWTAHTPRRLCVGLFPDQRAAAEALVRKAGYELLR